MKRLLAVLSLVLMPFAARAAPLPIISEIAWAGSSLSTADEWFELANAGDEAADLSGWSVVGASAEPIVIPDGTSLAPVATYLVANYASDDLKTALGVAPDLVTTAVALSNSALHVRLLDATGNLVDEAGAAGAPPFAGATGAVKASMVRRDPLAPGGEAASWESAATSSGFDAGGAELGTPGTHVVVTTSASETPATPAPEAVEPPPIEDAAEPASTATSELPTLRLVEAMPRPPSGSPEWVEILDTSASGYILDGMTVEDGRGTKTRLEGLLLPWGRFVVELPSGRLNDAGDLILLRDATGRAVSGVSYGTWTDAAFAHASAPERGESIMRADLGEAWSVTVTPTPGTANALTAREEPAVMIVPTTTATAGAEAVAAVPAVAETLSRSSPALVAPTHAVPAPAAVTPAKAGAQKVRVAEKTTAKKSASSYKGRTYEATVLIGTGLHSAARAVVMTEGTAFELRFTRTPTTPLVAGERVRFVAQEKSEDGRARIQTNPNSLTRLGAAAEVAYAQTDAWPGAAGPYALRGTVVATEARSLRLDVGGVEVEVKLPPGSGVPTLKTGDRAEVRAVVVSLDPPIALAAEATATLIEARVEPKGADPKRASPNAGRGLTAVMGFGGTLAYLRHQRVRRARMLQTEPLETLDE